MDKCCRQVQEFDNFETIDPFILGCCCVKTESLPFKDGEVILKYQPVGFEAGEVISAATADNFIGFAMYAVDGGAGETGSIAVLTKGEFNKAFVDDVPGYTTFVNDENVSIRRTGLTPKTLMEGY